MGYKGQCQQSFIKQEFHPEAPSFCFQGESLQEIWPGFVCLFFAQMGFSFLFSFIRKWDFQCIVFSVVANFSLRYYLVWIFF